MAHRHLGYTDNTDLWDKVIVGFHFFGELVDKKEKKPKNQFYLLSLLSLK